MEQMTAIPQGWSEADFVLSPEEVLFSVDKIPILSIMRSQTGIRYAVFAVDETDDSMIYVCAPISELGVERLKQSEITLHEVVVRTPNGDNEVLVVVRSFGNTPVTQETHVVKAWELPDAWIPEPGFTLGFLKTVFKNGPRQVLQ